MMQRSANGRLQVILNPHVYGRSWPVSDRGLRSPTVPGLYLSLFGHLESVVDLDAKVAHGAFQLRMAEQ